MEGGRKKKIPLNSGLDVKSSDQLVSVDQPLFQHNRQRFQGHTLPTSLRYEHNGYAAGWKVYEFEVEAVSVETSPTGFTVIKYQLNNNPSYIFLVRTGTSIVCQIYYNYEDSVKQEDFSISHDADAPYIVTLSGDNNGHAYEITINMVTGEIGYDSGEWYIVEASFSEATGSDGATALTLADLQSWVSMNIAAVLPKDISYEGSSLATYYSAVTESDGLLHTWRDLTQNLWTVIYNSDTNEATVNGEEATASLDRSNGILSIDYNINYQGNVVLSGTNEEFFFQVYDISVEPNVDTITSSASGETHELWDAYNNGASYLYPTGASSNRLVVLGSVPVWIGAVVKLTQLAVGSPLDIVALDTQEGQVSPDTAVFSGTVYFLTSEHVSFYGEDFRGSSGQFWIDATECLSDYATFSSTLGTYSDIFGSFTYCVCVFNRISIDASYEDDFEYNVPLTTGYASSDCLLITEEAPWFEGGYFKTKEDLEDKHKTFEAGFYMPVTEGEVSFEESSGGGYVFVPVLWAVETSYNGSYVHWNIYNELLESAAKTLRSNNYTDIVGVDFFIEGSGIYVNKNDEDERALDFLPSVVSGASDSWDFYTWEEWNLAAAAWNSEHIEEINNEHLYEYVGEGEVPDDVVGYYLGQDSIFYEAGIGEGEYVQGESSSYYNNPVALLSSSDGKFLIRQITISETLYERISEGWFINGNKDYYPRPYAASDVIGSGEKDGYARLEEPYAFYDIELNTEYFSGARYVSDTDDSSVAGAASIDLSLDLANSSINRDGYTFNLGNYGYLLPYFRTVSNAADSRNLYNIVSGDSSSQTSTTTLSFTKGPYVGLTLQIKATSNTIQASYETGNCNSCSSAQDAWDAWKSSYISSNSSSGYYLFSSASWCKRSGIFDLYRKVHGTVVLQRNNVQCIVSYDGATITSTYSNGMLSSTNIASNLGITPVACYLFTEGMGQGTDNRYASIYFTSCFNGYYQYNLKLNASDSGVFTSDTFLEMLELSKASDAELVNTTGFYIDRELDNTSDSYCSFFGKELIQLNLANSYSFLSENITAHLFVSPLYDENSSAYKSFYIYTGTSSDDALIPGQIYYGSVSSIRNGYNLTGRSLGTSYNNSSLIIDITGTVISMYRIQSLYYTWSTSSGTHKFFSDTLPQAITAFSVRGTTFNTPSNSANGRASTSELIYLSYSGEDFQIRVTYTLANDKGTTTVALENSSSVEISSFETDYGGYAFSFSLGSFSNVLSNLNYTLSVLVPLQYLLSGGVPYIYEYSSLSYDESAGMYKVDGQSLSNIPVGSTCSSFSATERLYNFITNLGYSITLNGNTFVFVYGAEQYDSSLIGEAYCVSIESIEYLDLEFILQGVYRTTNCELVSFTDNQVTVRYNEVEYTFSSAQLWQDLAINSLVFMATDVKDESVTPSSTVFARQDTSNEYQFLRQAWNTTVEVENFWWVDSETILSLTESNIIVKKKVTSSEEVDVDDWGGDAWEDAYYFDRADYLDNTTVKYGMTCAYEGAVPRFWTVQLYSSSYIQINFYTLETTVTGAYSFSSCSVRVPVNNVSIGSKLNSEDSLGLNTYSQLTAETLIYDSVYSGTVIGTHILFGIHKDNNFNQWALDISIEGELLQVVQGYGYVGLDGSLTGGEIPTTFFDAASGFNDTVYSLDSLEQEDIEYVTSISNFTKLDADGTVVGDESQQWYVSSSISSIVSHLTWSGSAWDPVSLNIGNNYTCIYGSSSFGTRVISCFDMFREAMSDLLAVENLYDSNLRNQISWSSIYLYGYCPKVSTMLYLQQTMGQYAYVHYNSATPGKQKEAARENTSKDVSGFGDEGYSGFEYTAIGIQKEKEPEPLDPVTPENTDDFSFNLHGIRQTLSVENPWSGADSSIAKFVLLLLSGLVSLGQTVSQALNPVNALQNQTSSSDIGRKFSQAFLKNIDMMASAQASNVGTVPTQQSAVASACTLDMFYSTCEGQKISAGPGWVNHNFVAQCVAQSVTSNQMEMNQIGMVWVMEGLSTVVWRYTVWSAELAYDAVRAAAEASGSMAGTGTAVATALMATATVVIIGTVGYLKQQCDMVDALIASISNGAQVQVQNTLSKHVYSMEGKHKYGQKSECFMWPCFDVVNKIQYTNESVTAKAEDYKWKFYVPLTSSHGGTTVLRLGTINLDSTSTVTATQDEAVTEDWNGDVSYLIANCRGSRNTVTLPSDMAVVIGTESFLPPVSFRNENIGVSEPVFATPPFQDYIIDKDWELSRTASVSMTTWVSCKDTKLIDGEPSNIVVSDDFCGVACPYTAIEVKRGCEQKYIRPWAITPNVIALNQTGYNCCYEGKAYHAFDGYGGRIVKWFGAPGMNKEGRAWQYAFIVNDRFKRSNKMPPNEFIGNFKSKPLVVLKTTGEDKVFSHVTQPGRQRGLEAGTVGEDKDVRRYAAPVFSEFVSTLPAVVKTISAFNLSVVDGITSLTSVNRDLQTAYKAPVSIDFAIGEKTYRFTNEYICSLEQRSGVTVVRQNLVPTLGLEFIGATPYEAYLYSQATRQYYTYEGGTSLNAVDMLERFRDVVHGRYDFVNQEVAMPCVATFVRLDKHVFDDEDERDNTIVPRLKGGRFVGEIAPPIETIYNDRSGFRTISLPSGLCYQGPNRCIINRFVYSDYMKNQIINNYGKWERVPREKYHPFRDYGMEYERVDESLNSQVIGWTHNPFLLVTSPLGVSSEIDCMFEWEITFAWPVEMDELYDEKQYAVVNIWAECFTPGGKVIPDRPTHVFLYKDLFTRTGNYGYYSFRYQSKCGAGNRERLHIWSDQYIAVSGLQVEYKQVTEKRAEVLTIQADVQDMEEI